MESAARISAHERFLSRLSVCAYVTETQNSWIPVYLVTKIYLTRNLAYIGQPDCVENNALHWMRYKLKNRVKCIINRQLSYMSKEKSWYNVKNRNQGYQMGFIKFP
uniref:Uncharacterized protein n=1 Tax=Cacopsylla melanoneura TaxID=428564 RepID=A0A8D8TJK4_9HEMI